MAETIKTHFFGTGGQKHNTVRTGESGIDFLVLRGHYSDADAREAWLDAGGDPDRDRCGCEHDCCGHLFHASIFVRATDRRTLVTQSWGLNV